MNSPLFYLGLVFYELFSGGETPPTILHDLACQNGAFVSLPRLSLCEPSSSGGNESSRNLKRQQGPNKEMGLCQISSTYLSFRSVPGPLCNLVSNMLDCIHGDLAGKESYTELDEVISDIKLMTKKHTLLRGLEIEHLNLSGLPLNEFVIVRKEQESIISSFRKCLHQQTVAVILGSAGSGKSFLTRQVGACIAAEGGMVLRTKFDVIKQGRPFAALSAAFEEYCDLLVDKKTESDWVEGVIERLQSDIGQRDLCYLMKIIPKLSQVINGQAPAVDEIVENSTNAQRRLHYLLCQFMNVILMNSNVPVTLVADDVHWADDASIEVFYQILRQGH
jgi:hypothetical protein